MKKIINGKLYDTYTAKIVAMVNTNGVYSRNDFRWQEERLCKKKTGEFFLYGEGGPMTKYAEPDGNGTRWGERIIPLTVDDAKHFVEKHCDVDTYIKLFGEPEE